MPDSLLLSGVSGSYLEAVNTVVAAIGSDGLAPALAQLLQAVAHQHDGALRPANFWSIMLQSSLRAGSKASPPSTPRF